MMETVEQSARLLHAALAGQRFAEAQTHLITYARELERKLRALDPAGPEAARIYAETHALFAGMRRTVLALQSHIKTQLECVDTLAQYLKTAEPARHTWNLEA